MATFLKLNNAFLLHAAYMSLLELVGYHLKVQVNNGRRTFSYLHYCVNCVIGPEQQLYLKRSCVLKSHEIHNGAKGEVLETSASEPPPCGVIRVLANADSWSAESYHDTFASWTKNGLLW